MPTLQAPERSFVQVAAYYGTSLPCLLVRLWTRRKGQKFADVPSHVALKSGQHIYQFISTGFDALETGPFDWPEDAFTDAVTVSVPDMDGLRAVIVGCQNERYSWRQVFAATLNRITPQGWSVCYKGVSEYDCSVFVLACLRGGGVPVDAPDDASPNDLMCALRTRLATQALAA